MLNDFEIVSSLGRGGMAETFIALRRTADGFEQRVCLKRILPAFAEDADFVRSFVEEARVSARLRHRNIVQILDFGQGQDHFLSLELIDGCNLRELSASFSRADESLPAGLLAYVAHELGHALAYAHDAAVIHRDISPANVLLSRAGEVKLADFGIAKALDQGGRTGTGLVKGKIPYMAPEYARGTPGDVRSDLYALGVTLFEAASGRRPFVAKNNVELLTLSAKGDHSPLRELSDAPPELCALIDACIAPDPDARPRDAHAFLKALDSMAPPPTARRLLGRQVERAKMQPGSVTRPLTPAEAAPTALAGAGKDLARDEGDHTAFDHTAFDNTAFQSTGSEGPSERQVQWAPPDAETRTRVPVADPTLPTGLVTAEPTPIIRSQRWWVPAALGLAAAGLAAWLLLG